MIEQRWGRTGTRIVSAVLLIAVIAFVSWSLNSTLNSGPGIYSTVSGWFSRASVARSTGKPTQAPNIDNRGGIYAPAMKGGQNTINNYGLQQRNLNAAEFAKLRSALENFPKDQTYEVGFTTIGADNAAFAIQIRDYLASTGHTIRGGLVTIIGSQTGVTYDPKLHNVTIGPPR